MRKLIMFIVILIAVIGVTNHIDLPEEAAIATVQEVAKAEAPEKTIEPAIEAATYAPVPTYTVNGGCEQYRPLISKYDWDVRKMMAIMEAESHCGSAKVGDDYVIAGVLAPSCGLLQVRTISAWRGTCEQLKDPEFNIDIAYKIYQGSTKVAPWYDGYRPWSVYLNGDYLQYLR